MSIPEALAEYLMAVQAERGVEFRAVMELALKPTLARHGHACNARVSDTAKLTESRTLANMIRLVRDQHGRALCEAIRSTHFAMNDLWEVARV